MGKTYLGHLQRAVHDPVSAGGTTVPVSSFTNFAERLDGFVSFANLSLILPKWDSILPLGGPRNGDSPEGVSPMFHQSVGINASKVSEWFAGCFQ